MKKWIGLLALVFACSAQAVINDSQLDLSKLTNAQRSQLKIQALQLEQEATKTPTVDTATRVRTEAEKWAELGTNVSSALIAGAKNVGVAANEFAQTPLGMVTTGIVVYKFIGRDILHYLAGLFLLIVGTIAAAKWFSYCTKDRIEYENIPRVFNLWVSRKVKMISRDSSNMSEAYFGSAILLLITWAVGFGVMF